MTLAFLICTEPSLEKKSVLLVRSIRRFGGSLSGAPVYSFCPRAGQVTSQWALGQFSSLGVVHDDRLLNEHYSQYGVNNKPFVCAYAETTVDADILVFLDSDKVVFNEPAELLISDDAITAVRPVNTVNIGVNKLYGGQNQKYWRDMFEVCGVKDYSFVRTSVDDVKIIQYFNSGMIATRPEQRVFSSWAANFDKVVRSGITPTDCSFVEQSVFSATVSSMGKEIVVLPPGYNYPIASHHRLASSQRKRSFEDVVSIHYHRVFDGGNWAPFLSHLESFERTSIRYDWLIENLLDLDLT